MPPLVYRLPQFVALLALGLLAAFTWVDKGPSRALQWPWYLYAQLLVLLPTLWLVAQGLIRGRLHRFGQGLDWALLGFAGVMIAAAIASPYPGTCLGLLPTVLTPVVVAYVTLNWLGTSTDGQRGARIAHYGALALVLTSALMLLTWFLRSVLPAHASGAPWSGALAGRNDQLLGHTVYVAGIGLLTTAWMAGLAIEREGRTRLFCLAGALVGLVLIATTGSRSGFIGLGAWLLWFLVGETRRRGWPWYRTVAVALILGTAATAVVSLHPRLAVIIRQWRETGTINSGDRQRLAMAEFGGLVLHEHPWLGIGPGATPQVYPRYRARLSGGVESALQLHSTPVQWAADAGLCGLAAAGCIVAALWWRRRHAPRSFAAGTLLAYGAFALTDYQLDLPIFAFTIGILLALVARPPASVPDPGSPPRPPSSSSAPSVIGKPIAIALAALVAAFVFTQIAPWRARAAFAEGIEALGAGDVSAFRNGMSDARHHAPGTAYYRNVEACILADILAYPGWFPPADLGADRLERALALFGESLAVDPNQELPHTHLAWLLLPHDPEAAAKHFRASARLIPDRSNLYFGLGLSLLAQNRTDAAAQALALEIINDPSFAASPEWLSLPGPPQFGATVRRIAAAQLDRIAAESDPRDSLRIARRARYAASLLRWLDGDITALTQARALAEPNQRDLLDWLSGREFAPPAGSPVPWHALARATALPNQAEAELQSHFTRGRATGGGIISALAQGLQTPDRRALLLLPTGTSPQLIPHHYSERLGYPLLMRNVDAPPPLDPHPVPDNRFVRDFLRPLFPEKGYLSAPLLTAELARLPE